MIKLVPAFGMSLIIEDKRDFGHSSIDIPDQAIRGVGTQGIIYAVSNDPECKNQYKVGDHVLFSKYNEQICHYENGKENLYYNVPVQAILATIIDA